MRLPSMLSLVALLLLPQCAGPSATGSAPSGARPPRPTSPAPTTTSAPPFEGRAVGDVMEGFRLEAFYTAQGARRGARLRDAVTGFTIDLVGIETAPQARLCVHTPPTTDRGEPHTQEHLLITKGRKGRTLAGQQSAWHVNFDAATHPLETCYGLAATGAVATFQPSLAQLVDTLLHPDYTDEEVRREVHHFAVHRNAAGQRELLELGAVYNEMVRTFDHAGHNAWSPLRELLYGPSHPAAREAGGRPDEIGKLGPEAIAEFHREFYRPGRMRLAVVVPPSMDVTELLRGLRSQLDREEPRASQPPPLPKAQSAPVGTIRVVPFPSADESAPGVVALAYPPAPAATVAERLATELVLGELADGAASRLALRLDGLRAQGKGFGAVRIVPEILEVPGRPVSLWIEDVPAEFLAAERVRELRDVVHGEVVAAMASTSPAEVEVLRARLLARLAKKRRALAEALESPPQLDERGGYLHWELTLEDALAQPGSDKSLLFEGPLSELEGRIVAPGNPLAHLARDLPMAHVTPFVVAARPSAELRRTLDEGALRRKRREVERLLAATHATTAEDALAQLEKEREAASAILADIEAHDPPPPPAPALPMTLDDAPYSVRQVGAIPVVEVPFATMTVASVGIALSLDRVPEELLPYLPLLPELLRDVGVREGGRATPHDDVDARLNRDVRGVSMTFAGVWTGRPELWLSASGLGVDETRGALLWLRRFFESADWDVRNLERLRALVDRGEERLLATSIDAEERWVPGLREAIVQRHDPAIAHFAIPFAAAHDAHRFGWMLLPEPGAKTAPAAAALRAIAASARHLSRADMAKAFQALSEGRVEVMPAVAATVRAAVEPVAVLAAVKRAGTGLSRRLGELPESTFREDVAAYTRTMSLAYEAGPSRALSALARLRDVLVRSSPARAWVATAPAQRDALRGDVDALLAGLATNVVPPVSRRDMPVMDARAAARGERVRAKPLGLVLPAMSRATVATSVPAPRFIDTSDDAVLDALASSLFHGGGATSLWAKTAAAGLAYSNGTALRLASGQAFYYAERCPDPGATLSFVADVVARAEDVRPMLHAAVAATFASRTADSLEERAAQLARDVALGVTPERVRAFHERVLAWAGRADLAEKLAARKHARHAAMVPGLDPRINGAAHGVQLFIGPESILAGVDAYLQRRTGHSVQLARIYPRDFWDVAPPMRP